MQIIVTLPPELVEAVQKNTIALEKFIAKLELEAVLPNEAPSKPAAAKEVEQVAETFEKDSFFFHEESDSYIKYRKGDIIPTDPDFHLCTEISKAKYEKGIAEETPAPVEEEAPVQAISLEVVRKKLAEISAQGKPQQMKVKEALTGLGFKKLSDVPAEQYGELLDAAGASV